MTPAFISSYTCPRRKITRIICINDRAIVFRFQIQHLSELAAELHVAQRIEEGVHGGVEVAYPRHGGHEAVADAAVTEGHDHEEDKVGHEAEGEGAHDHPQLSGSLNLLGQGRAGTYHLAIDFLGPGLEITLLGFGLVLLLGRLVLALLAQPALAPLDGLTP